jgi:hypothetical protein
VVAKVRGLNDDDLEQWEHFVDVEVAALREEWSADFGDSYYLPSGSSFLSDVPASLDEEDSPGEGSFP